MKQKNDRDEELILYIYILLSFVIRLSLIKIYFEYFTNNKQ